MRFVTPKSAEAQGAAVVFRTRDLLVRQRTQLINALRGHLMEFGFIVRQGPGHVSKLIDLVADPSSELPAEARPVLAVIADSLQAIQARILLLDREIATRAKTDSVVKRLMTIPGIGPVVATALVALAPAASTFRRGRDFAAWLGLTPRLQRGQGAAGPDNQDGRAQSAKAADPRSELGHKSRRTRRTEGKPVADQHAGPKAAHAGDGRVGEQDGEDRLGVDGARRNLRNSGYGGIKARRGREAVRRQEGQTRGMAQRSEDGIGKASNYPKRL